MATAAPPPPAALASGPPNLYVAISPKPGKEARVAELATQCAAQVKAHEPWISMYRVLGGKKLDDDKLECFFVVARVEDMSKIHSRREMEHHQVIARAIRDEDLLSEPLKYLVLDDVTHWMRMPGN